MFSKLSSKVGPMTSSQWMEMILVVEVKGNQWNGVLSLNQLQQINPSLLDEIPPFALADDNDIIISYGCS